MPDRAKLVAALRSYAATGIKAARNFTPSAMLAAAASITGKAYKRGEYERAATDIESMPKEKP